MADIPLEAVEYQLRRVRSMPDSVKFTPESLIEYVGRLRRRADAAENEAAACREDAAEAEAAAGVARDVDLVLWREFRRIQAEYPP